MERSILCEKNLFLSLEVSFLYHNVCFEAMFFSVCFSMLWEFYFDTDSVSFSYRKVCFSDHIFYVFFFVNVMSILFGYWLVMLVTDVDFHTCQQIEFVLSENLSISLLVVVILNHSLCC